MDDQDREKLLDALTARLKTEGAPQGVWLIDIARVRGALQAADDLLRDLNDAIIAGLPPLG